MLLFFFPLVALVRYLVPVLTGVADLSHRTWLENINESTKGIDRIYFLNKKIYKYNIWV